MAEVDDLRALLYELEDELTCLQADYRLAATEEGIVAIEGYIDEICSDITITRQAIAKLERRQNV